MTKHWMKKGQRTCALPEDFGELIHCWFRDRGNGVDFILTKIRPEDMRAIEKDPPKMVGSYPLYVAVDYDILEDELFLCVFPVPSRRLQLGMTYYPKPKKWE